MEAYNYKPADLSERQDKAIQMVAKYVSYSVDSGRYQAQLMAKTKHNSNFAFLYPNHKHNEYYQYLVTAYRTYAYYSAAGYATAAAGTTATDSDAYRQYAEAYAAYYQQQQVQSTQEPAAKQARTEQSSYSLNNSYGQAQGAQPQRAAQREKTPVDSDDDDVSVEIIEENGVRKVVRKRK